MTLHKSQKERRHEILAAARKRFVTDGYTRARLNDIAADAGLSKGGVYFHFKSKREIFDALVQEDFERTMQGLGAMNKLRGDVADRLTFFARIGTRAAIENPDLAKFQVVLGEMAICFADVRDKLAELHETFVQEVKRLLQEGVDAGTIAADVDIDVAARLLKSVMDGLRISIAAGFNEGMDIDSLIADGAELLIRGLANRNGDATG